MELMFSFRTVANRSCTLSVDPHSATFAMLLDDIASRLGLNRPTVKLLRGRKRLLSMGDLLELSTGDGVAPVSPITVVGSKVPSSPPSAVSPATREVTPPGFGATVSVTSWPLRYPHNPGGLTELAALACSDQLVEQVVLYEEMSEHPTIQHMSDLVRKAGSPTNAETILRGILVQVKSVSMPLFDWIQEHSAMFLSLLNKAPNPYINLASVLAGLLNGGASATIMRDGEAVLLFEPESPTTPSAGGGARHRQASFEDAQYRPPSSDNGVAVLTVSHAQSPPAHVAGHNDGNASEEHELSMLEVSVESIDDVFVEASMTRELALSYESLYMEAVSGRDPNAPLQLYESKTSMWFRKAVASMIRAVQSVQPRASHGNVAHGDEGSAQHDDEEAQGITMQALCLFGPPCFVSAQLWFKARDPMSSLAACLAHLTFWDVVEAYQQQHISASETHQDPFYGMVSTNSSRADLVDDGGVSVVYSHPGTVRASVTSVPSSVNGGKGVNTEESIISAMESVQDPFQETMRLMRYTQGHNTTVVLYSLLGPGSMLIYLLRGGTDIRIVAAPVPQDGFKGSMTFMEEALLRRRFGVNLNLMWTEHVSSMYQALVAPIEHLLPAVPREVDDADAGQVCFIVSFSPVPLPFAAMLDPNGVPVMAKWAVFQAHVPADVFAAEASPFVASTIATSTVLSENPPIWMTRQLAKNLDVSTIAPTQPGEASLILHVDNINQYSIQSLPLCDLFVCESFAAGMHYQIRRSALVRGMKVHEDNEVLCYEFGRSFYLSLCDGKTICRALRMAVLATMAVYPMEPWIWGSMILFNYGGPLPPLDHHIEMLSRRQHKKEVQSQKSLRAVALTPESRYSEYLGINTIYNTMLSALLRDKPTNQDDIEACMIACLETFPHDFRSTRPSSTTTMTSRCGMAPAGGKMVPVPPEKPPTKPPSQRPTGGTPNAPTPSHHRDGSQE